MKKIWLIGLAILTVGLWSNLSFAEIAADEYHRQGCDYYEKKDYSQAAKAFEKAVELKPDNAIYHYNLGITYCALEKYEKAIPHLKKTVEIDPDGQAGKLSIETLNELKKFISMKTEANSTGEFRSIKEESEAQKLKSLVFETVGFPDGLVGRRYSYVITPEDATPPYKLTLLSGILPSGLIINQKIGGIEGTPEQVGERELMLSLVDAKGEKKNFKGTIRIWRLLTVGEDGTFKGFDGLQMAINMAQDRDEIRIQSGIYKGTGLVIPRIKKWDYGIKISGGWDEDFSEKIGPTILDGDEKENRILTISNEKGKVFLENLTFRNSKSGAVEVKYIEEALFTNCTFTNNSAKSGGAISTRGRKGIFTDCLFKNNFARDGGGAACCEKEDFFNNCIFENNSAGSGGAVCDGGTFTNCSFLNNSAGSGGAVYNGEIFIDCIFRGNSVRGYGGAILRGGHFIRCIFTDNSAGRNGGVVDIGRNFISCLFNNNSSGGEGGAISRGDRVINCTFYNNKAGGKSGAISPAYETEIINSIFWKNMAKEENNDIESEGKLSIDYCLINYLKGAANFGPHNITGDPKFVEPENGNFSLRADSPCVDKGNNEDVEKLIAKFKEASLDLTGKLRIIGGRVDLGAYEWRGKETVTFLQAKVNKKKKSALEFETIEFPDGLVGRRYSFVIVPEDVISPYKLTFSSGSLPPGINFNESTGRIEGIPEQSGKWEFTFSLADSYKKRRNLSGVIRIWRLLTVGADGIFKGFDGIQEAISAAQDFDEIRIESGIYKGTSLFIPENKIWDYGIKISGGWNEDFLNRKEETILDGNEQKNRILTISNKKGKVFLENLIFRNSKGGAIEIKENREFEMSNCIFIQNSAKDGGAIVGWKSPKGAFSNCVFNNNLAIDTLAKGGAIRISNCKFINCIFKENFAYEGGAIKGHENIFIGCNFNKNSSSRSGGAIAGSGTFIKCTFDNNSAQQDCSGAVNIHEGGKGIFLNCNFRNNHATGNGGAICASNARDLTLINCLFYNNSSKKEGGGLYITYHTSTIKLINCLFYSNSASSGGGVSTEGSILYNSPRYFINCTFCYNNAKKEGGGLECCYTNWRTEVKVIINSIFYSNFADKRPNDITSTGGGVEIDYCFINHLEGPVNFGSYNITEEPKFVDHENGNFSLRAGSPCIDKGDDKILEELKKEIEEVVIRWTKDEEIKKLVEESISLDLAGNSRIVGGNVDLGAYEWQGK